MVRTRRRKIEQLDFILAGAQKSGTTALHYFLATHPKIAMGDQQEMHFFDDDAMFAGPVDYEQLHKHYPQLAPSIIAGDCTPSYIYHEPAAERIWQYNPKIKLIVLLRNPVERAFAHWNMQRFKRREPLDFLDAVKEEENRMRHATTLEARRVAYLDRGRYSEQLERVFKLFPRERIKIIKSEKFRDKNRETLDSISAFLGVKPLRALR